MNLWVGPTKEFGCGQWCEMRFLEAYDMCFFLTKGAKGFGAFLWDI